MRDNEIRILIIQEKGRHLKNQEFREALNFQRAFTRLGVESTVWGLNYDNRPFAEVEEKCDVIFLLENYEEGKWVPDLSHSKKLKVFWSIDSHCALNAHVATCDIHRVDIHLNSTKVYLHHYERPGRSCHWFPNCYPHDLIDHIPGTKKHGVGFCGNVVNRGQYISLLRDRVGMRFDQMVIGKDMVEAVNSYAVGWNHNIANDINYRTFETLGCRTFLLTDLTDGLHELFEPGRHLVTYSSMDDCIEKINYYLSHEKEREEMAEKGYEHVRKHHTFDVRAKKFLEIVKEKI